jgi:hypothetical protein
MEANVNPLIYQKTGLLVSQQAQKDFLSHSATRADFFGQGCF